METEGRRAGDGILTQAGCEIYQTFVSNTSMAWTIANNPNASWLERQLAGGYLALETVGAVAGVLGVSGLVCSAMAPCLTAAEEALGLGTTYTVYQYVEDGITRYIGMTMDFARRAAEHLSTRGWNISPYPGLTNLSYFEARAAEQVLIESYGLQNLYNQINSIASSNPIYQSAINLGWYLVNSH